MPSIGVRKLSTTYLYSFLHSKTVPVYLVTLIIEYLLKHKNIFLRAIENFNSVSNSTSLTANYLFVINNITFYIL